MLELLTGHYSDDRVVVIFNMVQQVTEQILDLRMVYSVLSQRSMEGVDVGLHILTSAVRMSKRVRICTALGLVQMTIMSLAQTSVVDSTALT